MGTSWTERSKPSSSWTRERENIGDSRITEGGDNRVTEGLFLRILEFFSWVIRTKP